MGSVISANMHGFNITPPVSAGRRRDTLAKSMVYYGQGPG